MDLLVMKDVTMQFGGLKAVDNLSFTIEKGQIFGLVGPNGSGKTTSFNMISGYYKPTLGEIYFKSKRIDGLKMHLINYAGIARTFQHISLFKEMTVLENVIVGSHIHTKSNLINSILMTKKVKLEEKNLINDAELLLKFVDIYDKKDEKAKNLSYGEQRMLEIARALASKPELIILDEPAAGMNPVEKEKLRDIVLEIQNKNITVLVIEHDMKFIMAITDRIVTLDHGGKIAEGTPEEIQNNEKVIEAYLGKSHTKKQVKDTVASILEQDGGLPC